MSDLPRQITICEEGPREGFQIERGPISTARKVELIDALSGTGLKRIQTVSFVPPRNVPGMADADLVVEGFTRCKDVEYTAIWMNARGLERAIEHRPKIDLVGSISASASAAFLARNQRRTPGENVKAQADLIDLYTAHDIPIESAFVMAAFGCNFEGDIAPSLVLDCVRDLQMVADDKGVPLGQLALGDTMAWATPLAIARVVGLVRDAYPDLELALHLHDTRGMGIANAVAGLQMGVAHFDTAVAGLGGCPFAAHRGAAGNVCTEDLVFMCHEMGIETGIDLDALIEVGRLAEDIVGHSLPGAVKGGGSLTKYRAGAK